MDLSVIVQRLRTKVATVGQVKFAISLAAALEDASMQSVGDQWIYVIPGSEQPEESSTASLVTHQRVQVEFGVWIITKNVRDRRGDSGKDDLFAVRAPLRAALHGWNPPGADEPLTLRPSSMQGINPVVSIWRDGYATSYSIRTADNP